jgi:hypothetical protein
LVDQRLIGQTPISSRAVATLNEVLGLHLAKPIANKYLVYCNVYENTVFCDWKRILVEAGDLASSST